MRKHTEQEDSADALAGVDQSRPFPRLPLKDDQWREIAKLSGIQEGADDARRHIETALGMFRQFRATDLDRMTSAKIGEELGSLADIARDLDSRLNKLIEERDAFTALTGAPNLYSPLDRLTDLAGPRQSEHLPSSLEGQRRLSQVLDVLLRLPKWLLVAVDRVKADKRGPKAGNVYWLVGNLDGIREQFTGKKITRSYKDDDVSRKYITYVCKIADPDIGDGTIDNAMKDRIKKTGADQ